MLWLVLSNTFWCEDKLKYQYTFFKLKKKVIFDNLNIFQILSKHHNYIQCNFKNIIQVNQFVKIFFIRISHLSCF